MNDPRDPQSPDRLPSDEDRPEDPRETPPLDPPPHRPRKLTIRIDRKDYPVPLDLLQDGTLTELQLRRFPRPNIGPERDLFEVAPGGSDRKIENDERVRIHDGLRFFSAPAVINPGSAGGAPAEGCRASH